MSHRLSGAGRYTHWHHNYRNPPLWCMTYRRCSVGDSVTNVSASSRLWSKCHVLRYCSTIALSHRKHLFFVQFFCILHFCHTCSLCRGKLVVQFPTRSSTQVLLCLFPGVLWLWHFLYSVVPHPVSNLHIYTFVVSRAFMAGAAKQEALTPPGHLVSPLVCKGPWMSTVVLYCCCHSDSASGFFCILHLHTNT